VAILALQNFLKNLGCNVDVIEKAHAAANLWGNWYRGYVRDFHEYFVYNGERNVKKTRFSLQLAKKICEKFANFLFNERVKFNLSDDKSTAILTEILKDNNFFVLGNMAVEKAFACGTCAFLVSAENLRVNSETGEFALNYEAKVKISVINAQNIFPISFSGENIHECVFLGFETNGTKNVCNAQSHVLDEKNEYVVTNYSFEVAGNEIIANIPENSVASVIKTHSKKPWFSILKPNVANNFDSYSPFGVSIFANVIDIIKALDLTYDSLVNEVHCGRKRLFVAQEAMKVGSADGTWKPAFDPSDVVFYLLENTALDQKAPYVQEINGQLRIDDLNKAMQTHLNLLGENLGFGSNYFEWRENSATKTATEVISENSELYRTICKHELVLENMLVELIKAIGDVGGTFNIFDMKTDEITIDFDDSIIESKDAQRLNDREDLAIDVMSRKEYRMKWYAEDEKTATERLNAVDAEKNDDSKITFLEGEID
jgi:A118 family predicted phage portal protein